jgi:[ribosomal protein S5]-alanine N-acetyltransferase
MTQALRPHLVGLPVLETERLILRAPQASDWPAFCNFAMSDRTRFVGGPKKEHEAFEKFCGFFGHWAVRGFGRLIITDRMTASPLGHVGPLQLDHTALPELTWSLWLASSEGKGYACEAARAVNRWLFSTLGWTEAKAEIHADNHASHGLARRLGGQAWPDAPQVWMPGGTLYRFCAAEALA